MIVNKELMDRARFEKKLISELTVNEFKELMQTCLNLDKSKVIKDKICAEQHEEYIRNNPNG